MTLRIVPSNTAFTNGSFNFAILHSAMNKEFHARFFLHISWDLYMGSEKNHQNDMLKSRKARKVKWNSRNMELLFHLPLEKPEYGRQLSVKWRVVITRESKELKDQIWNRLWMMGLIKILCKMLNLFSYLKQNFKTTNLNF